MTSADTGAKTILVTGGAGYLGSVLVPKLLEAGHAVRVLDLMWFSAARLQDAAGSEGLTVRKGDIRDRALLEKMLTGTDTVIHLACVSNDPCSDLAPELTKAINLDAYRPLLELARSAGVSRFINASSSSVYGVKDDPDVTEALPLEPLTLYARYKAETEDIVRAFEAPDFTTVNVRSATLCGYSPCQRLDLTVNILTNHGYNNGRILVHGGQQKRPNIHVNDTADLYTQLVNTPAELIAGDVFNVGFENHRVIDIAHIVQRVLEDEMGRSIEIEITDSYDERSYHISSKKVSDRLGFHPKQTIKDAIRDLVRAFRDGLLPDSMMEPRYFHIKHMQALIEQGLIRA